MKSLLKKILFITLFLFPIIPSIEAVTDEIIEAVTDEIIDESNTVVEQGNDRQICDFDPARDSEEILEIFKNDWRWLVPDIDFSPEYASNMLIYMHNEQKKGFLSIKLLCEKGKVAGFVVYHTKREGGDGWLSLFAVNQKFRCKGYGKQLVQYALKDLASMGANRVQSVTSADNFPAQRLYNRVGFDEISRNGSAFYFEYKYKKPTIIDDPL